MPKDRALAECCIQGILPEPRLQQTHTHTTYLLTYLLTLESRPLAQENTESRKIGTHCDPAAAYHLLRHVKDDVLADSAGHDVQWYAVACRIES